MQNNPIGWFEIYVNEMDRARAFYEAVFSMTLEKIDGPEMADIEMWGFPGNQEVYGATGALVKMDTETAGNQGTLVYFSCEDCQLEESRVEANGGVVQSPKMSIGQYGFVSVVKDTEGNLIGLHSMT